MWENFIIRKKPEVHFFLRAPAEEFACPCLLIQDDISNLQKQCLAKKKKKKNSQQKKSYFLISKFWLVFQLAE